MNLVVVSRCEIGVQLFVDEFQEDVLKYPPVAAEQGFVDSTFGHVGDQINKVAEALAVDIAPKGLDALVLSSMLMSARGHPAAAILQASVGPPKVLARAKQQYPKKKAAVKEYR